MPLDYEYDLDHHAILVSGWDQITLGDVLGNFEEVCDLPANLLGAVVYFDFREVTSFHVCEKGALQLAASFEKVLDRGVFGIVMHVTSENIRPVAEMLAFTFSEVCGQFKEGYRIARHQVPPGKLHAFLRHDWEKGELIAKVA